MFGWLMEFLNLFHRCFLNFIQFTFVKKSATYPLVYISMTDQTKETYSEIFKFLKTKKPNLKPSMLMVDFENVFISIIKEEFPMVVIRNCFFHFTQCVWRKIQNSDLQT